jgi:hypothetical protein
MANNNSEAIEKLAALIGENIYIDVAKWHLYLAEAHLNTIVAEKIYQLIEDDLVTEDRVMAILQQILVKLGGGKKELPLLDLLPMQCQVSLMDLLDEFQSS